MVRFLLSLAAITLLTTRVPAADAPALHPTIPLLDAPAQYPATVLAVAPDGSWAAPPLNTTRYDPYNAAIPLIRRFP